MRGRPIQSVDHMIDEGTTIGSPYRGQSNVFSLGAERIGFIHSSTCLPLFRSADQTLIHLMSEFTTKIFSAGLVQGQK